jgi:hypothetical protein
MLAKRDKYIVVRFTESQRALHNLLKIFFNP